MYVPPPPPPAPPPEPTAPAPEEEDADEAADESNGAPVAVDVTLAEEIARTAVPVVRAVARCRRCGYFLPSDMDAIERHGDECTGADGTLHTEAADPLNEDGSAAWYGRLEALARELGTELDLVRDRRRGKRLLRRVLVGSEVVGWLLERHPEACRDEEQAVLLGASLAGLGLLRPVLHDDGFRCANLFYRFEWDHVWLGGESSDPVADPRASAADYAVFDPDELLTLVPPTQPLFCPPLVSNFLLCRNHRWSACEYPSASRPVRRTAASCHHQADFDFALKEKTQQNGFSRLARLATRRRPSKLAPPC